MAFQIPTISYTGKIKSVTIGQGSKALTVGGESCYPFHRFEGEMPRTPVIAMEVWDMRPDDWPEVCVEPFSDVLDDPGAWARKCVDAYGAEAIVVQLKSTDPNGLDAPPEKASEAVGKVLEAVDVPVIVWGTANTEKDSEVLKKIAEDFQGKDLVLGPVEEDNHKTIGAAALGFNHTVIASSPIDVNLAKQLNILLGNLGVPMERIIVDPTTGGLGYGLEYCYSVMERIRMAALVQEDEQLTLPMINNVANEVWKTKEAKVSDEEAPELGDSRWRGVLMEAVTAVSLALAGSDILIMRHPEAVKLVRGFFEKIISERAPAAERVKVEREKAKPVAVEKPKPAAAKPAAAAEPKPAAAAPPKPEPKAAAEAAPAPAPEPATAEAAPAPEAAPAEEEAVRKAREEAEARAKAEADARAKQEAEARAKAEAEAQKAREEAEQRAKEEAERKAREEAKAAAAEELAELRRKRREEREKRMAELGSHSMAQKKDVTFGKGPEPGTAGPNAEQIIRRLERWRLRGDGVLRTR